MRAVACLLITIVCTGAWSKCALIRTTSATSPNTRFKVVIDHNSDHQGPFRIVETTTGRVVSRGHMALPGHHLEAFVTDRGDRILVVDVFGGYAVYDRAGKALSFKMPQQFLSKAELRGRPGYGCHDEGTWLKSHRVVNSSMVVFVLSNTRKMFVHLY